LYEHGEKLMDMSMNHSLISSCHSLYYGMAGIGLINIYYYLRSKKNIYLDNAFQMCERLLDSTKSKNGKFYCETNGEISIGLGYGQSGIALFFLRLYQITGLEKYLSFGKKYLLSDLEYCKKSEKNVISIPGSNKNSTLEPYIEEGSGGVIKVILRYHKYFEFDQLNEMINDIYRKYSVFCGLQFGLASFIDVFVDLFKYLKDDKFLSMAQRPIAGIRDLYLLKYPFGYAVPGDGLFRISCDYATGVAGVMRALHRYVHHDSADFLLDEVEK
ncbi:MAG: lanthionine synthetase C family protein, partial [Spirochaetes bacterium]|nr:lanthionine synthetase C family protein [Spirochaetota bacterium]